jgi:hypothetical protein
MVDFGGIDCALAESAMTPEAPVMATAPTAEVFKKLRREDCVISAPLINQFIADLHKKKPPAGGLGVSWRPGAV